MCACPQINQVNATLDHKTPGPDDHTVALLPQPHIAYRRLHLNDTDLIVLDIVMPDSDGGAIAQDLGEDPELKSIPIVFLSAIIKEDEMGGQGMTIGGSDHTYLAKPVEPDELISHIQERLGVNAL